MRSLLAALLFVLVSSQLVFAGGGKAYPLGAEGFLVGAAPPPGLTILNYAYFYSADELKDSDGDEVPVFDDITVWAEVMRFIYFTKKKLFGGTYGQHFFLLAVNVDLDFKAPVGPKRKRNYDDFDVPYIIYSPFLLSWHLMQGKLHLVLDIADIYIPLSNEDDDNLASVGRNFWTIEPVFAITYMFTPRLSASLKLMYDFNTEQNDYPTPMGVTIDRTPGQEFHFDWCVSYALKPNFRVGITGYYYRQVKNDDFDFDDFSGPPALRAALEDLEDNQGRVWAIGPGVWYQQGKFFLSLRTQFEFGAREMTKGQNVWFKMGYVF
ncbi:MAG: hypothetical protein GXO20_01745 [Thermodesulfobacteria bacterium]|nr:hypothetical protein [Thermodesulfobacteriota bacterium]